MKENLFLGGGEWKWNLEWRRDFFEWELPLVDNLLKELEKSQLKQGIKDFLSWKYDSDNGFTVKEAYKAQIIFGVNQDKEAYSKIWNVFAPSKVMALGW